MNDVNLNSDPDRPPAVPFNPRKHRRILMTSCRTLKTASCLTSAFLYPRCKRYCVSLQCINMATNTTSPYQQRYSLCCIWQLKHVSYCSSTFFRYRNLVKSDICPTEPVNHICQQPVTSSYINTQSTDQLLAKILLENRFGGNVRIL